jgi:tRNA (uracil-5-)-methyltransferase TRM9
MDTETAARLIELNKQFYQTFGREFSSTRGRIQPGVRRILEMLKGDESILDLGCGNGELARELARRGHSGPYTGLDFSLPLLSDAERQPEGSTVNFVQADLTFPGWENVIVRNAATTAYTKGEQSRVFSGYGIASSAPAGFSRNDTLKFDIIFALATLHHIPTQELRLSILQKVHGLLRAGGRFVHSEWQFLNSEKLRVRIQPWESAGLSPEAVEASDYLLDWRRGGHGLRYVHHFDEAELNDLAAASRFRVRETFRSDGENGRLGLYQVWEAV